MYVAYLWNRGTGKLIRVHSPEEKQRYIMQGWEQIPYELFRSLGGK